MMTIIIITIGIMLVLMDFRGRGGRGGCSPPPQVPDFEKDFMKKGKPIPLNKNQDNW